MILVSLLLVSLVSAPAAVAAPASAPAVAAPAVATPQAGPSCGDIQFAANRDGSQGRAFCDADCGPYAGVWCSGNSCNAVDRNCAVGQRGFVVCDGNYTYCPVCPAVCEEDSYRLLRQGTCCPAYGEDAVLQQCIGGQWVSINTLCAPSTLCLFVP